MKRLILLLSALAISPMWGCASADPAQKSEGELIELHRQKIVELRREDQAILSEIDGLLNQSESLLIRAEQESGDTKTLLLNAAHALLVEANTRRLYAQRKASYEVALSAYNKRSERVISMRNRIESNLPKQREAK